MPLTRSALLAVLLLLVALVTPGATEHAQPAAPEGTEMPAFPPSAVTMQDKIDWLTVEADAAAQAVDAEAEKPLSQQREALYRTVLARGLHLMRLMNTIDGRFPRLEARVSEIMTSAAGGLERIAN